MEDEIWNSKLYYTYAIRILDTLYPPLGLGKASALPRFTSPDHILTLARHCHDFKTTRKTNLYEMQMHHN